MPDNLGLLAACIVPALAMILLRINAVMVFFSLCLGAVLVQFVGDDATVMLNLFSSRPAGEISKSTLHLALLLLPALCTSVFMLFSVHGRGRVLYNILPAFGATLLGVLLAVPLLGPGVRYAIQAAPAWHTLAHAQAMIVGGTALLSLLFLWMQRHDKGRRHHGSH